MGLLISPCGDPQTRVLIVHDVPLLKGYSHLFIMPFVPLAPPLKVLDGGEPIPLPRIARSVR